MTCVFHNQYAVNTEHPEIHNILSQNDQEIWKTTEQLQHAVYVNASKNSLPRINLINFLLFMVIGLTEFLKK